MGDVDLARRLAAEGLGTAGLLAVVVGSGIMGETLAGGYIAIALLGNTIATGVISSRRHRRCKPTYHTRSIATAPKSTVEPRFHFFVASSQAKRSVMS